MCQADRENAELLLEQGKKADEAFASAVTLFHRELKTDSGRLKASGAPYKVRACSFSFSLLAIDFRATHMR